MRRFSRDTQARRVLSGVLIASLFLVGLLVPVLASSRPAAAASTPVLGPSRLTGAQIAAWFRASTRSPYRASVSVERLAAMYVDEGGDAFVRGDVAFAQSVLETGWFSFPSGGYVRPTDNNFGGIGAFGDGSHLFRAPSARIGVRGQIQLLRRYADPFSKNTNIGHTPVSQLWNPSSNYNNPGGTHGWATTWEAMTGRWASSPTYTQAVLGIYTSMLTFNGLVGNPGLSTRPIGSLDGATRGVGTITASGWAVDPATTRKIPVHIYVDGVGAAITTANKPRPDVGAAVPGAGASRGFTATFPVTGGTHTVCAYAISATGGENPQVGCRVVRTNPIGFLDQADAQAGGMLVQGWALSPDRRAPIAVHIYVDGVGRAVLRANRTRNDVGAAYPGYGTAHGFSVTLPRDPAARSVCAYAISPSGGANTKLGCKTTVSGTPFGSLDGTDRTSPSAVRVRGWAISGQTTRPVSIHIYANGTGVAVLTARTPRPDVRRFFPAYGTNHGFDVTVPAPPANATICAYAINPVRNSPNRLLGCRTA